jgi:hypothetical protein
MAKTFYAQNIQMIKSMIPYMESTQDMEGNDIQSVYISSFLTLDPCGRYHHAISPNGLTQRCINYWESLDKAAYKLGCWIESGEGDPTDIFLCAPINLSVK